MTSSVPFRHLSTFNCNRAKLAFTSSIPLRINPLSSHHCQIVSPPVLTLRHASNRSKQRQKPAKAKSARPRAQPYTKSTSRPTYSKPTKKSSPSSSEIKAQILPTNDSALLEDERETTKPKYLKPASKGALSNVDSAKSVINWYPGHIAKAERTLKDSIKLVDVIIEVLDSRIPLSTKHPLVKEWIGTKRKKVIVFNRMDLIPNQLKSQWITYFNEYENESIYFLNSRQGHGIKELKKSIIESSKNINEKRSEKGLLDRPIRCLVLGYPNVGKSALINKLVGKNCAKSQNKPGVTRNYQWIRISKDLELLDMPGIIPSKFITQQNAIHLAFCDDIGQAAYDNQIIAAKLIDHLNFLHTTHNIEGQKFVPFNFDILNQRFGVNALGITGEDFLHDVANETYHGNQERVAVRLLTEFRAGILGPVALEVPNMVTGDNSKNENDDNQNRGSAKVEVSNSNNDE